MTKYEYRVPTPEELYALEASARRLRAKTIAGTFRKAIASLKSIVVSRSVRHA